MCVDDEVEMTLKQCKHVINLLLLIRFIARLLMVNAVGVCSCSCALLHCFVLFVSHCLMLLLLLQQCVHRSVLKVHLYTYTNVDRAFACNKLV